ncbi:hypothetical protein NG791_14795 [Laspinema sp. D1]|uniref:hypothetical protein n=1 Tax=Laspinema palackyanum TaxID=3231601 RepID=UPI00347C46A1|nr:hypothetical protein [Laspinema sp. D2b]
MAQNDGWIKDPRRSPTLTGEIGRSATVRSSALSLILGWQWRNLNVHSIAYP